MPEKTEIHEDRYRPVIALLWLTALLFGPVLYCTTAHAQMINQPWGFTQQNRASIAALMKQTEDSRNATAATATPGSYDQLVCGGDDTSSAAGNSTCIILNNSDGAIQIGQDTQGDQEATSIAETLTSSPLSSTLENIGSTPQ